MAKDQAKQQAADNKAKDTGNKASPGRFSDDSKTDDIYHMLNLTAVDSKYSWFVVVCSFFCNMIVDGMQYTFANFLGPILITFNSTTMAVSLIGSLLSGFYNFSGPLAGALANKFGFRMVAITGSVVSAFGLCISYFATDVGMLYFTYGVLGGLGFGMIYMSAVITTSLYFDKYRALASSISVCGTGIGTFVFSPLGNWLVVLLGWRMALVVEGGIVLLCILFGMAFKPIDMISIGSLSEEDEILGTSLTTIRTIRTIRDSFLVPYETTRALPNQAYPTLKQALGMQDDDGRRSIYSKSARASTVFSLGQSLMRVRQGTSGLNEDDRLINLSKYDRLKRNLTMKVRRLCDNCWHCRCHDKRDLTVGDRPMYRDDVFYEGSLSYLRNYSKIDPIDYHLSVIRMPNERDAEEHRRQKVCGCHEAMLRTFVTMTGLNLLKSTTFVFLCISSFMYTMGVFIPYIFIRALAEQKNIEADQSIWLVSSIGVANTAGRILSGVLMSCMRLNAAALVFFCTFVSSVICLIVLLPVVVESVFVFTTAFGFFTAPFVSLRPVVIVEFLGLEKLTNAFGLVLLSQGVASILGPPLAGIINEATGQITYTIIFAGALLLISASTILVSTMLVKKQSGNVPSSELTLSMSTRSNVKENEDNVKEVKQDEDDKGDGEDEEFAVIPPNGGWGWVVVVSAFYCNLVTDGIQLTFGVFLQSIANYFSTDISQISLVGSLMFGVHLLAGPICSGLSSIHGIRPITAAGSLITASGLALCYFINQYQYLYFLYGIMGGFGLGLVYMNSLVITSLYFTTRRLIAIAFVVCGTGCGTVTFALLGSQLLKITDWRTSFLVEAALAGTMLPAALTFRPLKAKRIIITSDTTLIAKHSAMSKISRVSKVSRYGGGVSSSQMTVRSRRATVYIQREPRRSLQKASSLRSVVLERFAHQTIVQQVSAQLFPRRSCPSRCCRHEGIVYVHTQEKETPLSGSVTISSVTGSLASNISLRTQFSKHVVVEKAKKQWCNCGPLKETILEMLNFRLLRSYAFLLFCLSGGFAISSLLVVLMYEKDRSILGHGYSEEIATLQIVTLGAANTFWRIFLGVVVTFVKVDVSIATVSFTLIAAVAVVASGIWENIYVQFVTHILYGLGVASVAVFRPALLIDLVGGDHILNGTGISLLFMGVACITTPPLIGLLVKFTENYDSVVYAGGSLIAVSGLLLINIHKLRQRELRRLDIRSSRSGNRNKLTLQQ